MVVCMVVHLINTSLTYIFVNFTALLFMMFYYMMATGSTNEQVTGEENKKK